MSKKKIHDPEEHWKPLIFDSLDKKNPRYFVSTMGRFKAYTQRSPGTIIRGKLLRGYFALDIGILQEDGTRKKKTFCCHKLVAETFVPNLNKRKKKKVIHLDYDIRNNRPENLDWATNQEASDHQKNNPKFLKPSTVFRSKMNINDVTFMKDLLLRNIPQYILADYFGLSEIQVGRIARGESWKEIGPKFPIKK